METLPILKAPEFRKWLHKNHKKESKVAVQLYKRHTGKPAPTHRELINEAICYGWIDTTIKRIDDDTFLRRFAKRTEKSSWSNNTLSYAKQLLEEGKMQEQGIHFYELGLKKPVHDHGIPKNPTMPTALKKALAKNKEAQENFAALAPSTKKMVLRWLLSAKLPKTKEKRIARIVEGALRKEKNIVLGK